MRSLVESSLGESISCVEWQSEQRLAEQGTDPAVIQRMLRHSSKDMTMHYIHAKAREAQEQYIAELGIVPDEPSGSAVRVQ